MKVVPLFKMAKKKEKKYKSGPIRLKQLTLLLEDMEEQKAVIILSSPSYELSVLDIHCLPQYRIIRSAQSPHDILRYL